MLSVADTLGEPSRSLDDRLNEICLRLCQALQIEAAAILLVDPGSNNLVVRGRAGLSDDYLHVVNAERTLALDSDPERWAPTARAFKERHLVVVDDVFTDASFQPWREAARREGYVSFLAAPLFAHRAAVGCLNCYSATPGRFGEGEVRLLSVLAHFLGIATEVVQLYAALQAQYALLDRSQRIHEALTSAAFKENSLEAVAATLAHLLEAEVLIVDRSARVQAASSGVTAGTAEAVLALLQERAAGRRDPSPFVLRDPRAPAPAPLALACPALAGDRLFGHVVLLPSGEAVDALAVRGLEHAATVVALEFSRRLAASEAEMRQKAHVLNDLLTGEGLSPAYLRRRAGEVGLPAEGPFQVLLLATGAPSGEGTPWHPYALRLLEDALQSLGHRVLFGERNEALVAVVAGSLEEDSRLVTRVGEALRAADLNLPVRLFLGGSVASLGDVHRSYAEARQALAIASALGAEAPLVRYRDLGIHRFLMDTKNPEELLAFAADLLGPVLAYQEERGVPLVETLYAYFDHQGSIPAAARAQHLHPNTIRYRLTRALDLAGLDATSLDHQLELRLALETLRLTGPGPLLTRHRKGDSR